MKYVVFLILLLVTSVSVDAAVRRTDVTKTIDKLVSSTPGEANETDLSILVNSQPGGQTVKIGEQVSVVVNASSSQYLYLASISARGQLTLIDLGSQGKEPAKKLITAQFPASGKPLRYQSKPVGNVVLYLLASEKHVPLDLLGFKSTDGKVVLEENLSDVSNLIKAFKAELRGGTLASTQTRYVVDHNDIQLGSRAIRDKLKGQVGQINALESVDSLPIQGITFESNSATLTSQGVAQLMEVADALNRIKTGNSDNASFKVILEGHTDDLGQDNYNQHLSEKRADAARSFLINQYDFTNTQIEARGLGENSPIVPNDNNAARSKNRRVDIRLGE